jgi:ABC-2 type transport system permease protein
MKAERVRQMLRKEFIQVLRDPRMRMVIFVVPVVQVLVFGYAVTTDVKHLATVVQDLDNSAASRELAAHLSDSGYFDIVARDSREDAGAAWLDRGRARVVLRIARGFEEELRAGRSAAVQLLVDGTDSNTARIGLSHAVRIAAGMSEKILMSRQARTAGAPRPAARVELRARAWFNENLDSRNFYVPGVIALLVTLVTLLLTSMAVVREKEIGTMEQILVTPITPAEFILGKTIPFALIGFVDVLLITSVGVFWFDVPIRGSPALLLFSTALYMLTSLGVGLLVSTVSRTQQQAMMSTFMFFFPAVLLSGFVFPIANMPAAIRWLTYLDPLRYFIVIIRGIFLKGTGVRVLWPPMAALAAIGTVTLWTAVRRFHKTLG